MKKKRIAKFAIFMAIVMSLSVLLAGCGILGDTGNSTYTIQYTDDAGTHQLSVTGGMPYALESVPYKYGYEFLGLFDAQEGGTQYVSANGASLAPYTAKKNMVLFPQFKAIEYTVILDYQGAEITGERSLTASYNASLPELPKNLVLEHNKFTGWYTEAGGKGTQIADAYGLLPVVSVLNESNFNLDDANRRVYLYAGFELETYTVTFHFDEGMATEEVKVPYNTPIGEVVPSTRNSRGEAGLVWSRTQNDTTKTNVFDGRVTGDMVLYVAEWAPVIELNVNGGDEVAPIVARAGASISLPTPTKTLAKFLYWETVDGKTADITTMPEASTTLKAIWQAKIEFDENGGSEVDDISVSAGTTINLPTPTREGYIFGGWYTADKELYERTSMPSEGIALKAGWYQEKEKNITVVTSDTRKEIRYTGDYYIEINLSNLAPDIEIEPEIGVRINMHFQTLHYVGGGYSVYSTLVMELYNSNERITSQLIKSFRYPSKNLREEWQVHDEEFNFIIKGGVAYIKFDAEPENKDYSGYVYVKDFYYTLYYPDTTYLYL